MKKQIIQYKLKTEKVETFLKDIKVLNPQNMSYKIYKLEDNQSFVHFYVGYFQSNPAFTLFSFREMQFFIKENCVTPPNCVAMNEIGIYNAIN